MKFLKGKNAFTLIETLVVMGITVMLSVIVLGYNRSSDTTLALYRDQALVVGALNRAKALAIEKFNSLDACAYGVHFERDSKQFLIFKDLNKNQNVGADCRIAGEYQGTVAYESGIGEEEGVPFDLDSRSKLVLYDGLGAKTSFLDILFIPPDPVTTSTQGLPLTVQIESGGVVKVIISQGGQITGR